MSQLFLKIVNMSISAGYIVAAVLLLRLLLKKAPKWITVVLWGIVAVRLICPFSIESVLSLIPSAETVSPDIMTDHTPEINTGIPIINSAVNPIIGESFTPAPGASANPLQIWIPIMTFIWIVGIAAMLIYTAISYIRVRRKVGTAILLRDNIYQSENVVSPFVLGLIRPKIYLPFGMNEKDMEHVVSHERAHISRRDHFWKPLGFLLLTVHWFNPLLWLGYVLLCRDIELACDEKVIKELDHGARADYSQALLTCSVNRRMIAACPLAFGEVGVKDRIKSVLNYKKPAFWIIIAAVVACAAIAVCFLTDPISKNSIGIKSISAKKVDNSTVSLKIKYSYPTGGYSVRPVDEAEGEYCGDGIKEYDGSLGKHRILIEFGDTEPSKEFMKKYPAGETVELEDSPIKIRVKRVHPEDHGFYLYVGFDHPVSIDVTDNAELKPLSGTLDIKVTVFSKDLIQSIILPADDQGKYSYIYVSDYGCNENDVIIDFQKIRVDNGEIVFDIEWQNYGEDTIAIGPDFEVYKYNGSEREKLELRGVWNLNLLIIPGNPDDSHKKQTVSYNLSSRYDVTATGKYRFESHGTWVEFQIIDNFSEISLEYDRATFDVDGDGVDENCSMRYGTTSGLFTFVFLVQNKDTGEVEYENTIYSDVYDLSFEKGDDRITRVKAVTKGETPRTHLFDISIVNGIINLTENGVPIGDIASNDTSVSDIIDQLDAACKEQLVWTDGDYAGSQYEGIICYLCKADAGHVFIASIQWKGPTWTGPGSMTLGDYFFGGYTGVSRNKAIYIYDGEKVTNIISAYNSGLLSDKDLDLVYRKWVESSVISAYENDLSQKYELLGIEAITETDKIIAYAVKVFVKDSAWDSEGSTLKVGNYEFRSYGKNAFIYVYNKADFGGNGAQPLEFMYDHYKDKIESELATIYSYWQANLVDN